MAQEQQSTDDQVIERFTAELGRDGGLAVQGLAPVAEALREANAAAVLVEDPTLGDRTLWTSSDPTHVAVQESELRSFGAPHISRHRADEVVARAAAATGTEVLVADGKRMHEGIGALLRHRP